MQKIEKIKKREIKSELKMVNLYGVFIFIFLLKYIKYSNLDLYIF